jgi:hypothetical protein
VPEQPNWRRVEQYAYTADLTLRQWAWEFLRRSKPYRRLWVDIERAKAAARRAGVEFILSDELSARIDATGLMILDHPHNRAGRGSEVPYDLGVRVVDEFSVKRAVEAPPPRVVLGLWFDLSRPVTPQLNLALKHLKAAKKHRQVATAATPRFRRDPGLWKLWLRLLDARSQRASIAEMGRVLFPADADPRKSAQRTLRRASAFSEFGYAALARVVDDAGGGGRGRPASVSRPRGRKR